MTERAVGFWWVRLEEYAIGDPTPGTWTMVQIEKGVMFKIGTEHWDEHFERHVAEWGPYLGKEPGGTVVHALAWARDQGMTAGDIGRMFDEERRILGAPFESGKAVLAGVSHAAD